MKAPVRAARALPTPVRHHLPGSTQTPRGILGGSGYLVGLGKALEEVLHVGTQLHVDLQGNSVRRQPQHPKPNTQQCPPGEPKGPRPPPPLGFHPLGCKERMQDPKPIAPHGPHPGTRMPTL